MNKSLKPLSAIGKYQSVIVRNIDESLLPHNIELEAGELERRILEIGIVEGVKLKVLHFGLINRDPIAVQIETGATIAIRRNEAQTILVEEV